MNMVIPLYSTITPTMPANGPCCSPRCDRTGLRVVLTAIGLFALVGWCGCGRSADPDGATRNPAADRELASSRSHADASVGSNEPIATGHDGLPQLRQTGPAWFTDQDDPGSDGWDTEVISQRASDQLKAIGKLLSHPDQIDAAHVAALADDKFSCGPLRPAKLEIVYEDPSLAVSRSVDDATTSPVDGHSGDAGPAVLAKILRDLIEPLGHVKRVRAKFKLFRVALDESYVTTQAYFEASGHAETGTLQQNATWTCRWTIAEDGQPPRLASIEVEDYEEVVTAGPPSHLFSDVTEAVLGRNPCFSEQLRYGQWHWTKRIQATLGIDGYGHQGVSIGDVNGDGLEDVYVPQNGGLPNRLFRQNRDGTASDVAAEAGVDFAERTHSALFLDLDNDGDQDLVATTSVSVLLLANDGAGHFTRVAVLPTPNSVSMAAADFDHDGDLDLYLCNYNSIDSSELSQGFIRGPIPFHDANNGAANVFYRNDGDWNYLDVTRDVGLDMNNRRWSLAAAWEDYDNDGDADLYVANDFGRNNLYRNDAGKFLDVAAEAGVEDTAAGMSVSWGDYDRDGWMDLYVGNMFSAAGNRVTFQRKFQGQVAESTKARFQRLARGNTLFLNAGDGTFKDVSQQAAVTMGRWAWSSLFVDLNNDGWEDLLVANGYITNRNPDDL